MTIELTSLAKYKSIQANKSIQIILEIDGIDEYFGSDVILKVITVGMPGLLVGDTWKIGGVIEDENQNSTPLIKLSDTTNTITQQLDPDKATGSSISQLEIALIDQSDNAITKIITPGLVVTDILTRQCKVWFGFQGTAFKRDYLLLFRGIISEISSEPGLIKFLLSHPDEKKRQDIFTPATTELASPIATTGYTGNIDVTLSTDFLAPVNGPNGSNDTSLKFYIRINDELMRYTSKSTGTINITERGVLGTIATTHAIGEGVTSFYVLEGNAIDLALKIMLSGKNGPYKESVNIKHFEYISAVLSVENTIFFDSINVANDYGVVVGDYVTTVGATNGANNVTLKQIESITQFGDGSYIVISGVTFTEEIITTATISFRSQYDTLGVGLKMNGDDVDIERHLFIQSTFLSNFSYRFYLTDTINGREFLDEEIYKPAASYSLPRKTKSSLNYHSPPFPGTDTPYLNKNNIKMPSRLKLKRSLYRNFYNTVLYKFDKDIFEDRFFNVVIHVDGTSLTEIPVGNKTLSIVSLGMRSDLSGVSNSNLHSTRRLNRYKRGSEHINALEVMFNVGFNMEIGDILLFNGADLKISNTTDGNRDYKTKLVEVINKSFDLKTGNIILDIVDTNFDAQARYGLMSPSSIIQTGISTTSFVIQPSFSQKYASDEWRKWQRWEDVAVVRIRSLDYSVSGTSIVKIASSNTITLDSTLGFIPATGYIMEMAPYDEQNYDINTLYASMRDTDFGDSRLQFKML